MQSYSDRNLIDWKEIILKQYKNTIYLEHHLAKLDKKLIPEIRKIFFKEVNASKDFNSLLKYEIRGRKGIELIIDLLKASLTKPLRKILANEDASIDVETLWEKIKPLVESKSNHFFGGKYKSLIIKYDLIVESLEPYNKEQLLLRTQG